jgi:hypothetical protein
MVEQGGKKFQEMAPEYQANRKQLHDTYGKLKNSVHDAGMSHLIHSDIALRHYKMAGMTPKQAMDEHKKQMALHAELPDNTPTPFQEYALSLAWNRANAGKKPPEGLGYSPTKG